MLKNWTGSDGGFRHGDNWLPSGTPAAGDELIIAEGTARLRGGSFGSADASTIIHLAGNTDQPATLLVANATLTDVAIDEGNGTPGDSSPHTGTLVIKGHVVNEGGSFLAAGNGPGHANNGGNVLDIEMQPRASLVNDGQIAAFPGASLNIDGGDGRVVNDGTIAADGGTVTIASRVTGTGDIVSSEGQLLGGRVELESGVGAGQTVHLERGTVQIDEPQSFLGSLDVPAYSGFATLEGVDAASWATNGSLLELFNGSGALADTVRLTPQANPVDLKVSAITDPTFGAGVSVTAVPPGAPYNGPNLLPQQDFVPPTHGCWG